MGHRVSAEELESWMEQELEPWKRFAGSWDERSDKHFEVSIHRGLYRVMDHGVTCYEGPDKLAAVEAYNEAR